MLLCYHQYFCEKHGKHLGFKRKIRLINVIVKNKNKSLNVFLQTGDGALLSTPVSLH